MICDNLSQQFISIFQFKMRINMLLNVVNILGILKGVFSTIDINLSELEYLAAHLDPFECRQLVAALHYKTYDLPENIAGAERKIDEDIPCIRQLLHWNNSPSEGVGATHEDLEHRLRQINRHDLAKWLGKTVFKELGNDIAKSIKKPFGALGERETETQYPITLEPIRETEEENPWTQVDTILMAVLVGLVGCLVFVVLALIFHKVMSFCHQTEKTSSRNLYEEEEKLLNSDTD